MVDTGTTSLIIKDIERFKNFDVSFQPDNPLIELADGSKMNGVALKRGDTEICLVNANGNKKLVTLKGALFTHRMYFLSSLPRQTFKKNKNELIHKDGTKFNIFVYNRLYYVYSSFGGISYFPKHYRFYGHKK